MSIYIPPVTTGFVTQAELANYVTNNAFSNGIASKTSPTGSAFFTTYTGTFNSINFNPVSTSRANPLGGFIMDLPHSSNTDTTSSGSTSIIKALSFFGPTLNASNPTTYAFANTLTLSAPTAGTNVTIQPVSGTGGAYGLSNLSSSYLSDVQFAFNRTVNLPGGSMNFTGANLNLYSSSNINSTGSNISVYSGSIGVTGGNITLTSGSFTATGGNINLTGNMNIKSGSMSLTGGNFNLTSGNMYLKSGNFNGTGCNLNLTAGNINITNSGNLNANSSNVNITDGFMTLTGNSSIIANNVNTNLNSTGTWGSILQANQNISNDVFTTTSGTIASHIPYAFGATTIVANNTSVTTTNAANVYIEPCIAGTNETLTNNYALWSAGSMRLDQGFVGNATIATNSTYNTLATDYCVFCINSAGDVIVNLTQSPSGRVIFIKGTSGNAHNLTIQSTPHNIDGTSTLVVSTKNGSAQLISDGTNWWTLAHS